MVLRKVQKAFTKLPYWMEVNSDKVKWEERGQKKGRKRGTEEKRKEGRDGGREGGKEGGRTFVPGKGDTKRLFKTN